MMTIRAYSRLKEGCLAVNGQTIFRASDVEAADSLSAEWLNEAYRALGISYPKFFKMDRLSKGGFLAAEAVLDAARMRNEECKANMAVVLSNRSSSLEDDAAYCNRIGIDNYFPSPALFVYTLANIVGGEIAIRNHISGETISYVDEHFDAAHMVEYVGWAMEDESVRTVLLGWVESLGGRSDMLMLVVDRNGGSDDMNEFREERLNELYNENF